MLAAEGGAAAIGTAGHVLLPPLPLNAGLARWSVRRTAFHDFRQNKRGLRFGAAHDPSRSFDFRK
jgi:hypothetical protein